MKQNIANSFTLSKICLVKLFFNVFNIYLFLRETETECERGRGREKGRQNPEKAPGSKQAVSTEPDAGLEFTNRGIMT